MPHPPILIVGAGLTGLSIGYLLEKKGVDYLIVEAKRAVGGRIETISIPNQPPIELGATWIHNEPRWLAFLQEIGVKLFIQNIGQKAWVDKEPEGRVAIEIPTQPPMYRVQGGTHTIVKKLTTQIPANRILKNTVVRKVTRFQKGDVKIETDKGNIVGKKAILTLPPKLIANTVNFKPQLSSKYLKRALECSTWMEYSIKFAVTFSNKFWDQSAFTLFSQFGCIQELYDHSSYDEKHFALKGFVNPSFSHLESKEREKLIIQELKTLYTDLFPSNYKYLEKVWLKDPFISNKNFYRSLPKQNNGATVLRQTCWENSLFFAGTETAPSYNGYIEGAFFSATETVSKILAEE